MSFVWLIPFLIPWEPKGDLEFRYAVEEFVIATQPHTRIPEPHASLINAMGASCFACRNIATKKLYRISFPPNDRWLFWAANYRDAAVRARANEMLWSMHRCPECLGSGTCEHFAVGTERSPTGSLKCRRCGELEWTHHSEYYERYHEAKLCLYCDSRGSLWRGSYGR